MTARKPHRNATSWHRIAETCMVTSHHCSVLYGTLADRVGDRDTVLSQDLLSAAEQARQSREEWLNAARELREITTEVNGPISPVAAEAADLALWTGKLAYADPGWALPDGPSHPHRDPASLAPQLADVPGVADAIHQASQACASLAAASLEQATRAVEVRRVLIYVSRTARCKLASGRTMAMPVQPASGPYVAPLLACCRNTAHAARQAADAAAGIAARTGAPSRVLAEAKTVAREQSQFWLCKHPAASAAPDSETVAAKPRPTETSLRDLGVTNTRLLWRGKSIDQAARQVVDDAAAELRTPQQPRALAGRATGPAGNSARTARRSRDLGTAARRTDPEAEP